MYLTAKSFLLLCLFMGRNMRKKYFQKHWKNISFSVSLKSSVFEVVIVNWGLEGSNMKILRPGRTHMPRNIQNYWFLTKKHHVKKSVPQIYNSPRALALKKRNKRFWLQNKSFYSRLKNITLSFYSSSSLESKKKESVHTDRDHPKTHWPTFALFNHMLC